MYKALERIEAAISEANTKLVQSLLDEYISEQMRLLKNKGECDNSGIKEALALLGITLADSCTEERFAVIDKWLPCIKWYVVEGGKKTWIRITKNGRSIQKPQSRHKPQKEFSKLPKDVQRKITNFRKKNNPSTYK